MVQVLCRYPFLLPNYPCKIDLNLIEDPYDPDEVAKNYGVSKKDILPIYISSVL